MYIIEDDESLSCSGGVLTAAILDNKESISTPVQQAKGVRDISGRYFLNYS